MPSTRILGSPNVDGQRPILTIQGHPSRASRRAGFNSTVGGGGIWTTSSGDGLQFTGAGGPEGNPSFPCFAGPEQLIVDSALVPIDRGTAYLQDFRTTSAVSAASQIQAWAEFSLTDTRQQHPVVYDVYLRSVIEQILTNPDEILTLHLPIYDVTKGATVTQVINGVTNTAATNANVLAALQAGGANAVTLDGSTATPFVNLFFDAAELTDYPASRIVRMGIRYLAWKDESAEPGIGEGLNVYWIDAAGSKAGSKQYASWAVPNYQKDAEHEIRWLGEVNYITANRPDLWDAGVFTGNDIFRMADYNISTGAYALNKALASTALQIEGARSWNGTDTNVYVDFIEMVVDIIPERRILSGARIVANLAGTGQDGSFAKDTNMNYSLLNYFAVAPTENVDFTMTIREAIPADPSDRLRAVPVDPPAAVVPVTIDGVDRRYFPYTEMEAIGPSVQLYAGLMGRPSLDEEIRTRIAPVSTGVLAGAAEAYGSYILDAALGDNNSPVSSTYYSAYRGLDPDSVLSVHGGTGIPFIAAHNVQQAILIGTNVSYDSIKVLLKPRATTTLPLVITLEQPLNTIQRTITILPSDVPDERLGNDFAEMLLAFTAYTPAPGILYAVARSDEQPSDAWIISGGRPMGDVRWTAYNPENDPPFTDFALVLCCVPSDITPPVVVNTTVPVSLSDSCSVTGIGYNSMSWVTSTDYDEYAVERATDTSDYLVISDDFNRVVVGGIGTADSGQTWVNGGGGSAANWGVDGAQAVNTNTNGVNVRNAQEITSSPVTNFDAVVTVTFQNTPSGGLLGAFLEGRVGSTADCFWRVFCDSTGSVIYCDIIGDDGNTIIGSASPSIPAIGVPLKMRLLVSGTSISGKVWKASDPEPDAWTVAVTDIVAPAAGGVGIGARRETGNTNVNPVTNFDTYRVTDSDAIASSWETVAILPAGTSTYNDYSAPWDVAVLYRIVGFRTEDQQSVYSLPSQPAIIGSQDALLGISSGSLSLVYAPVNESGVELSWEDLSKSEIMSLHGQDYNRMLHAPEDRGLQLTVDVLIRALTVCDTRLLTGLDRGEASLTPTPFDTIRDLAREQYLFVRFPGGDVRTMGLQLGDMTVTTAGGIYMAQLILTDVYRNVDFVTAAS